MVAVVALISCVKSKRAGEWPASELYCSPWFRAALAYAKTYTDRWFILSAKYGLLRGTQRVASYEETLKDKPVSERRRWAESVNRQIADTGALGVGDEVLWLAGKQYREHLGRLLHAHRQQCPLQHLRQGEQTQWLQFRVANPS